ncbi:MAG TPA: cobalamin biosynthesis protein CobD [Clostridiaceae bacterium]|nr:cobalamin biosynthesis protein CobD [Clostridiaceae bacterium]
MTSFMNSMAMALLLGALLDQVLGDPSWFPHPVIFLGRAILRIEKKLHPWEKSPKSQRILGGLLFFVITFGTMAAVALVLLLARHIAPWLFMFASALLFWLGLAKRSLEREARRIYEALVKGDLEDARGKLSYLVTRDTGHMSEEEVVKGVLETVTENTSDGVLAPLFYGCLLGPVGMWGYKAINTLDSMVGYKTPRHLHFGRVSAKMDDVLNYVPARLTAFFMLLVGPYGGRSRRDAWTYYHRDRDKTESPNAGHPEAAAAGIRGISLGGEARYFGKVVSKPLLGPGHRPVGAGDILWVIKLLNRSYGLALPLGVAVLAVLWR